MTAIQRDCPNCPDPCKDRHQKIWDLVFRQRPGGDGTKGLFYRFAEQVAAGAQGPGTQVWATHQKAIREQQVSLRRELDRYNNTRWGRGDDDQCPDTPLIAEAREWARKPLPSDADWEANNPAEMSTLERVGWGALGVVGVAVTAVAIVSPFEGPLGDTVAGAATLAAWKRAIWGAGAVAAVAN